MKTGKEIQSTKVGKNPDPRSHLEAIEGLPPGIRPVNLFYLSGALVQAAGINSVTSVITYRDLIIPPRPPFETLAPSLDVSGVSATGGDGKSVFNVMMFVPYTLRNLAEPVHIVATPHGSAPSFLTVEHTLVGDSEAGDIEITVYAWDHNGNPATGVLFDWRCRLNGVVIELLN